jgi:hypothetical protein
LLVDPKVSPVFVIAPRRNLLDARVQGAWQQVDPARRAETAVDRICRLASTWKTIGHNDFLRALSSCSPPLPARALPQ